MSELLEAALDYARRGWPVFPCDASPNPKLSKRPLTQNGFKDASTDEAAIRAWWKRWPNALIGVPMGKASGVFAVDPDGPTKPGHEKSLATWNGLVANHGCPPTHTHLTPSGGMHVLFRWRPDRPVTNSPGKLPGKIEVRGEGGYIIAPPSKIADAGYCHAESLDYFSFADAPDWLYELLQRPEAKAGPEPKPRQRTGNETRERAWALAALDGCSAELAREREGGRNNALNGVAFRLGRLVGAGFLDQGEAEEALEAAAQANGLVATDGIRAVRATIASGLTAGMAKPSEGPEDRARQQSGPEAPNSAGAKQTSNGAAPLLIWHGDLPPDAPPFLVKGVLPETGIAIGAGQSGFAKTFGIADLAVSVMTGIDFAGRQTCRTGGVLWLAAEGESEIDARIRAVVLDKLDGEDRERRLPFARQADNVPVLTDKDVLPKLRALVDAAVEGLNEMHGGVPLALVVIDTLSAAAGFDDENSASETQKVMNVARELSRLYRALVLVIDHYGKVAETGVRGSSAKQAAADAVLAFLAEKDNEGNISNRRMAVAKLRGGKSGVVFPFALRQVSLDAFDGTTCVIDWQEPMDASATIIMPKSEWRGSSMILRRALDAAIGEHGKPMRPFGLAGPEIVAVDREHVRDEFYAAYSVDKDAKPETKRRTFNRLMDSTLAKGLIVSRQLGDISWIWFDPAKQAKAA